ncbi:DUF4097 family beta strand repeat-containing protein [Pseudoteredinibacter isoporae]|uniref:DUF4097 family beta strand repeat-containing protein n=1 Tax=Pseudoteredinibacter isoporae TaxID=570281 RepID=UPI00310C4043
MKHAILTFGLAVLSSAAIAGQSIEKTLDAESDGRVYIDNMRGNITIIGWDKNQVKVSGELDDEAEGYEFERQGQRVVFEVDMPRGNYRNKSRGSELTFHIPKNSKLFGEGVLVDFEISDIHGGSIVETVNGSIKAESLSEEIRLETINGHVSTENLSGQIEIQSINGGIEDRNSSGTLEIKTVNGPISSHTDAPVIELESVNSVIELESKEVSDLRIQTANARANITIDKLLPNADVSIDSVSGRITLNLDADVSADFSLRNHAGGRIKNQLSDQEAVRPQYGPGRSLDMTLNNGSADVRITSVSARIELKAN